MTETKEKDKPYGCDLCKIFYTSQKDLKEHLWSLIHHTKIEDQKRNSTHVCSLCKSECKTIPDYRKHLLGIRHKKAREKFNKAAEKGEDYVFSDSDKEEDSRRKKKHSKAWWDRNQSYWKVPQWRTQSPRNYRYSQQTDCSKDKFGRHTPLNQRLRSSCTNDTQNEDISGRGKSRNNENSSENCDNANCDDATPGEFENPYWHSNYDWQQNIRPLMMVPTWQGNGYNFDYQNSFSFDGDYGRYQGGRWNKNFWKNYNNYYGNIEMYDYQDTQNRIANENVTRSMKKKCQKSKKKKPALFGETDSRNGNCHDQPTRKLRKRSISPCYRENRRIAKFSKVSDFISSKNLQPYDKGDKSKPSQKKKKKLSLSKAQRDKKSIPCTVTSTESGDILKGCDETESPPVDSLSVTEAEPDSLPIGRVQCASKEKNPSSTKVCNNLSSNTDFEEKLSNFDVDSENEIGGTVSVPAPLPSCIKNSGSSRIRRHSVSSTRSLAINKSKSIILESIKNKMKSQSKNKVISVKGKKSSLKKSTKRTRKNDSEKVNDSLVSSSSSITKNVQDEGTEASSSSTKNLANNDPGTNSSKTKWSCPSACRQDSREPSTTMDVEANASRGGVTEIGKRGNSLSLDAKNGLTEDRVKEIRKPVNLLSVDVNNEPTEKTAASGEKSQKTLTKEALLKLVNSPRSRKERLQLANMLKNHAQSQNRLLSTRISSEELDIAQVKHDLTSFCESLGGDSNVPSIKIEDLTPEMQLQIAQLIEDDSEMAATNQVILDLDTAADVETVTSQETKKNDQTGSAQPVITIKLEPGEDEDGSNLMSSSGNTSGSSNSNHVEPESVIRPDQSQCSPDVQAPPQNTVPNNYSSGGPSNQPNYFAHPQYARDFPFPPYPPYPGGNHPPYPPSNTAYPPNNPHFPPPNRPFPPNMFPPFPPMPFFPPDMFNPNYNPMRGYAMFPAMGNQRLPTSERLQTQANARGGNSDVNDKAKVTERSLQDSISDTYTMVNANMPSPIDVDSEESSEFQEMQKENNLMPPTEEEKSVLSVILELSVKDERTQSELDSLDVEMNSLLENIRKSTQQLEACKNKRKKIQMEQKLIREQRKDILKDWVADDSQHVRFSRSGSINVNKGIQVSDRLDQDDFRLQTTSERTSENGSIDEGSLLSPRPAICYNSFSVEADCTIDGAATSAPSAMNSEVIVESDCSSQDLNMDYIKLANNLDPIREHAEISIKTGSSDLHTPDGVEVSAILNDKVAVVSLETTCESPFTKLQKISSPPPTTQTENELDEVIFSQRKQLFQSFPSEAAVTTEKNFKTRDTKMLPPQKEAPNVMKSRKRSVSESDVDHKRDGSKPLGSRNMKYLGTITNSTDSASLLKKFAANFSGVKSVSCLRINKQNKGSSNLTTPVLHKTKGNSSALTSSDSSALSSLDSTNQHCEKGDMLKDCSIILEKLETDVKISQSKKHIANSQKLIESSSSIIQKDQCSSTIKGGNFSVNCEQTASANKGGNATVSGKIPPEQMNKFASPDNCVVIDSSSDSALEDDNLPLSAIKQKLQSQTPLVSAEFSDSDSDEEEKEDANISLQKYFEVLDSMDLPSEPVESSVGNEKPFSGPSKSVCGLEILKNDIFICYSGYGVRRFSLQTGKLIKEYDTEENNIQCVALGTTSAGEPRLYMGGPAFYILCYQVEMSSPLCSIDVMEEVKCLHSDYGHVYGGLSNGMLEVVNLQTNKKVDTYQSDDQCIHCITSAREGGFKLLCVSSRDATITVLDAFSGLPVRVLEGHTRTAFCVKVSMNKVFSGSGDKTVMVHDLHTGELEHVYKEHKGMITSICTDGNLLFSASYDGLVRCFDSESQVLKCIYYGARYRVVSRLAIHDGKLYTGNRDGEISVISLNQSHVWPCQWDNCSHVFGVKDHLLYHVLSDHVPRNSFMTKCTWRGCKQWFSTNRDTKTIENHMLLHLQSVDV